MVGGGGWDTKHDVAWSARPGDWKSVGVGRSKICNAIISGKDDNPTVVPSVRSNLSSILGRAAAY